MTEHIYILNENGTYCGLQNRQYVHDNGILHPTVQCWIINKNGDVLIQRRAATKDHSAEKWDVSFGGHCTEVSNANDILVSNVIKEGKEELGLDINPQDIIKLGEVRYTSQKGKNREIIGVFLININDNHTTKDAIKICVSVDSNDCGIDNYYYNTSEIPIPQIDKYTGNNHEIYIVLIQLQ